MRTLVLFWLVLRLLGVWKWLWELHFGSEAASNFPLAIHGNMTIIGNQRPYSLVATQIPWRTQYDKYFWACYFSICCVLNCKLSLMAQISPRCLITRELDNITLFILCQWHLLTLYLCFSIFVCCQRSPWINKVWNPLLSISFELLPGHDAWVWTKLRRSHSHDHCKNLYP